MRSLHDLYFAAPGCRLSATSIQWASAPTSQVPLHIRTEPARFARRLWRLSPSMRPALISGAARQSSGFPKLKASTAPRSCQSLSSSPWISNLMPQLSLHQLPFRRPLRALHWYPGGVMNVFELRDLDKMSTYRHAM